MLQLLLEATDVIILIGLILMRLSHLRNNETGSPVTPESALHNIGRKMIAKVNDFVPRNIQKCLDTFLKRIAKKCILFLILFLYLGSSREHWCLSTNIRSNLSHFMIQGKKSRLAAINNYKMEKGCPEATEEECHHSVSVPPVAVC